MTPTPHDTARRAAEEIVLAWANEDTFVGGEPSLRERNRLVARITAAIAQAVSDERATICQRLDDSVVLREDVLAFREWLRRAPTGGHDE